MPLKNLVESRIDSLANMVVHEIVEDNDTTLHTIIGRLEEAIIRGVYTKCGNNKMETAKRLGVSRGGLYIKLRYYGLITAEEGREFILGENDAEI